ncbi:MAG: RNA polymerase sigma factor [Pseudomonadota bacterium]
MRDKHDVLLAVYIEELPRLKRYLASNTGCESHAEDLAQETWLRLVRYPDRAICAPTNFIWRIARNLVIDLSRRSKTSVVHGAGQLTEELADVSPGPEAVASAKSDLLAMQIAISSLPARRRAMFVSAVRDGRTSLEIAHTFDVSKRTVELEIRMAIDHCADAIERPMLKAMSKRAD